MTAAITFLAFIAIAGFFYVKMIRARDANPEYEAEPRPTRRLSSKQRKLEKLKEFEASIPPRPTIQELMYAEVRETGVDQIPGGDGLELPVRLKVWHRDEPVRAGCAEGGLRYVLSEGTDPASATEEDVMLVCDVPHADAPVEDEPGSAPKPIDDADADPTEPADDDPTT